MTELKVWFPEDDNLVIAQDVMNGWPDVQDDFPTCEMTEAHDIITITGDDDELDDILALIEDKYSQYGRIARKKIYNIKESKEINEAKRIASFDEEMQYKFDKLAGFFAKVKSKAKYSIPENFERKIDKFILKFESFKEMASEEDQAIIQTYIDDCKALKGETKEIEPRKIRLRTKKTYENPSNGGNYRVNDNIQVYEAPDDIEESYKQYVKEQLSNLSNWGIVDLDD